MTGSPPPPSSSAKVEKSAHAAELARLRRLRLRAAARILALSGDSSTHGETARSVAGPIHKKEDQDLAGDHEGYSHDHDLSGIKQVGDHNKLHPHDHHSVGAGGHNHPHHHAPGGHQHHHHHEPEDGVQHLRKKNAHHDDMIHGDEHHTVLKDGSFWGRVRPKVKTFVAMKSQMKTVSAWSRKVKLLKEVLHAAKPGFRIRRDRELDRQIEMQFSGGSQDDNVGDGVASRLKRSAFSTRTRSSFANLNDLTEALSYDHFADTYTADNADETEVMAPVVTPGGAASKSPSDDSLSRMRDDGDGPVASPLQWAQGVRPPGGLRSRQGRFARWSQLRANHLLRRHAEVQHVHNTTNEVALTEDTLEEVFDREKLRDLSKTCKTARHASAAADKARVDAYNRAYRAKIIAERKRERIAAMAARAGVTEEADAKGDDKDTDGESSEGDPDDNFRELTKLENMISNCKRAKDSNAKFDELRKVFPRDVQQYLRPEVFWMDDEWLRNPSISRFGFLDDEAKRKIAMDRILSSVTVRKDAGPVSFKKSAKKVMAMKMAGAGIIGKSSHKKVKRSVSTMFDNRRQQLPGIPGAASPVRGNSPVGSPRSRLASPAAASAFSSPRGRGGGVPGTGAVGSKVSSPRTAYKQPVYMLRAFTPVASRANSPNDSGGGGAPQKV
ncbi:unnamed protein product [Amoebophrya sp. A120]|nr:unnamed protein product [Amoebophrya sp. A120]|eukprot:GSA120T00007813001.1